jgi:hypothetical protein
MAAPAPSSSTPVAIVARLALIDGNFPLPDNTTAAMGAIRAAVAACAKSITDAVLGVSYDPGRLIAALDDLQRVKDVACCSVILPHAPRAET